MTIFDKESTAMLRTSNPFEKRQHLQIMYLGILSTTVLLLLQLLPKQLVIKSTVNPSLMDDSPQLCANMQH